MSCIRGLLDHNTGCGFDDRIYWTFIQLVIKVRKSLSHTLSSTSDWTLHWKYSDFQLNSKVLLISRYIISDRTTTQKTHQFPSNGCPSIVERVSSGMCLPSRCLAKGIRFTVYSQDTTNKAGSITIQNKL
jgi:hypothetical protein